MRKQFRFLLRLLFGEAVTIVCLLIAFSVSAQQPSDFLADLAPPVYLTTGANWIAYGYLYPPGTFDNLPPCAPPPDGVMPIGSYRISGEYGSAAEHAATYVLRFGSPMDGKQFVFGGIFQFNLSELNQPESSVYSAVRLSRGVAVEEMEVEFTPRSSACLGGSARVLVQS